MLKHKIELYKKILKHLEKNKIEFCLNEYNQFFYKQEIKDFLKNNN